MNQSDSSRTVHLPNRIVSGGQTGVDRAGLDVAIHLGIEHGGWCPAGRRAEDGTIPSCYQLVEMESVEYPARTEQNVIDSDATLILFRGKLKGGTLLTQRLCKTHGMPYRLARMDRDSPSETQNWLLDLQPHVLNIAGPRESTSPGIGQSATEYLLRVFDRRDSSSDQTTS